MPPAMKRWKVIILIMIGPISWKDWDSGIRGRHGKTGFGDHPAHAEPGRPEGFCQGHAFVSALGQSVAGVADSGFDR